MEPTIGRIVHFNMSDDARSRVNGNKQDKLPAVIVAVWGPTCVNLKVITDGVNDLWITYANQGDQPGQWNWPVQN